jgi:hypothetical protein
MTSETEGVGFFLRVKLGKFARTTRISARARQPSGCISKLSSYLLDGDEPWRHYQAKQGQLSRG